MTDQKLIKGCLKNDRRSQNALYQKYFPLMSSITLRYGKDQEEALQLMNYGFLKVLKNLEHYNSKFALATFIRNVLVNHCIDEYRKVKKYIPDIHVASYYDYAVISQEDNGLQKLETQELRTMLSLLPEVTQKVFNLFAIDGFKHKEISEKLSISEGTSKWHVSDARHRLKKIYLEYYSEKKTKIEMEQ
jgi:RNA polymerase sigma-70 factor (ECF subfamily)